MACHVHGGMANRAVDPKRHNWYSRVWKNGAEKQKAR
jgi:hypothetical protein